MKYEISRTFRANFFFHLQGTMFFVRRRYHLQTPQCLYQKRWYSALMADTFQDPEEKEIEKQGANLAVRYPPNYPVLFFKASNPDTKKILNTNGTMSITFREFKKILFTNETHLLKERFLRTNPCMIVKFYCDWLDSLYYFLSGYLNIILFSFLIFQEREFAFFRSE